MHLIFFPGILCIEKHFKWKENTKQIDTAPLCGRRWECQTSFGGAAHAGIFWGRRVLAV